jgi:hypothetical protein
MKKIIFIMLMGFAVYGYFGYHFILFNSSVKVLKKVEFTSEDTFIDARGAKALKLLFKPSLAKAGFKDLLNKEGL